MNVVIKNGVNLCVVFIKMKIIESVELEKAHVHLLNENRVKIVIKEHVELDESDIRDINKTKNTLVKHSPYVVVFVAPKNGSISRKARELAASREVCFNAICKAIVAPSKTSTVIGSFFISFMRPYAPTKLFSNESDAFNWVKKMELELQTVITN